jgi:hypothetical protein
MTQTLRRSKSKYARTRRQNKKQRRIRGGGFLDDIGNRIVGTFKPSTPAEKCQAARKAAREACSNVEGDIEMTEMPIDKGLSSGSGDELYSAAPRDTGLSSGSGEGLSSGSGEGLSSGSGEGLSSGSGEGLSSGSGEGLSSGSGDELPGDELPDDELPGSGKGSYSAASFTPLIRDVKSPLAAAAAGGAKKSKKKNKKRSQSRRKKLKSRKHNK